MLKLTQQELTLDAAGPDGMPRRTLAGLALPYNVEATVSDGTKVMFLPGSLNAGGKMPKLYLGHDSSQAVGLVTAMVDSEGGMLYEARISETTLGNEALVLAADGVLDAVSVGVNPTKFSYDENGTMVISAADWQELSLVPYGAFPGASVDRVAASIHHEETEVVLNSEQEPVEEINEMSQPVEAPATFRRPVITVRPTVTQQPTGQLNTLDPSTVTVANNNVNKLTFGTYVTMSEQDLDWTDPASINIVLNQLAIAYGQATDNYAVDTCHAAIVQTSSVADTSDPADWIAAIYEGARQISANSNYLPTHMVVTPTTWAALGSLVDTTGRPVFPQIGAMNAPGELSAANWNGNPLGLVLVVDKNTPGSFMGHAAGPAAGFEFYEQQKGAISVDVPSTLGRTIAYRGYAAAFMADATKFVKFV
jgi:HK97 family phage prohead protease